ncbi:MAG: hypothetical protein RIR45_1965, partial [Pseudomonadota bacterium]
TARESRIMKRSGGGFDYAYNAQTAVDETAQIIVAAEVVNTSSDVQQLPMVLKAVKAHTGAQAAHMLADAGYRSEAVMAELAQTQPDTQLVIALGREGKVLVKPRDGACSAISLSARTLQRWQRDQSRCDQRPTREQTPKNQLSEPERQSLLTVAKYSGNVTADSDDRDRYKRSHQSARRYTPSVRCCA